MRIEFKALFALELEQPSPILSDSVPLPRGRWRATYPLGDRLALLDLHSQPQVGQPGVAKVTQPTVAKVIQKHVLRLQALVDDAERVQVQQPTGPLG